MTTLRRHYPDVKETTLAAHIYAATANVVNRADNHPYLGRRDPLLRRIDHGLYVRATPVGASGSASSSSTEEAARAGGSVLSTRSPRDDRARANLEALIPQFGDCVLRFESGNLFSGPSVYFHERAIERRRMHATAESLLRDVRFLEYVYAVLPSWGMHRMGPSAAKVTEFGLLVDSLRSALPTIEELWPLDIRRLDAGRVPAVAEKAWEVIASIKASTSETQVVAGSKTLHQVLPDLMPPIDRQYTARFFTGIKALPGGDKRAFLEWLPYLAEIGRRCGSAIEVAMARQGSMATGSAKVVDNAIIGFMLRQDSSTA